VSWSYLACIELAASDTLLVIILRLKGLDGFLKFPFLCCTTDEGRPIAMVKNSLRGNTDCQQEVKSSLTMKNRALEPINTLRLPCETMRCSGRHRSKA
jgi:hypothetical protein